MKILVTGGLGYIGSHISSLLGNNAIIIDNQSNSSLNYKKKLPFAKVYKRDLNSNSLIKIFSENKITGVIHLASLKAANESVHNPLAYYEQNVVPTIQLLQTMRNYNINNLIFSSSATVYGNSNKSPLNEDMILNSVNPYGSTKICIERLIQDYCKSNPKVKAISLRYFNPLGADKKAGLMDQPKGVPQNILPILINSIKYKKTFKIFGNDYKTRDGTCIRDYIHVKDLAKNIVAIALKKRNFGVINVCSGKPVQIKKLVKKWKIKYKLKINLKFNRLSIPNYESIKFWGSDKKLKKILN